MKIRQGFVSNSSSSSFIIFGVDTSKVVTKSNNPKIDSFYLERSNIDEVTGIVLVDSDEYFENGEISIDELIEHRIFLVSELGVTGKDLKIYYGERPC